MTMQQVSKGEFDRRVKLLEQKVKESTSSLIARLQAESEAFIEKLRNTQLDIESLRNEIDGTETDLDNLVSSYNNFKANTLRINDVFDTDGQFDGTKIRPLSIETAALSVGQRSQQLSLSGIEFKLDPYSTSGGGILYWKSTSNNTGSINTSKLAGIMFHYGYGTESDPKIYCIKEGSYPFTSNDISKGFYIYAQIPKSQSTTPIYTEPSKITEEYFNGYFEKLYTKSGNNYTKVYSNQLPQFVSSADYYIYVNNKYEKITINNNNFRKNLVGLYIKSSDTYSLVLQDKPPYNSSTEYCTKVDETMPEEDSTTIDHDNTYINKDVGVDNTATILVTEDQFTYKGENKSGHSDDDNNFYIQLGYVSVELNKGTTNNAYYRKVDLTYGTTTINGRLITTGRIEGNSGVFIDLDNGEFGGGINKITVGSGSSTIGLKKGESSNIALWAGSQNPLSTSPIYIKTDGSAKFGDLNIAPNGKLSFTDTNFSIEKTEFPSSESGLFEVKDEVKNYILWEETDPENNYANLTRYVSKTVSIGTTVFNKNYDYAIVEISYTLRASQQNNKNISGSIVNYYHSSGAYNGNCTTTNTSQTISGKCYCLADVNELLFELQAEIAINAETESTRITYVKAVLTNIKYVQLSSRYGFIVYNNGWMLKPKNDEIIACGKMSSSMYFKYIKFKLPTSSNSSNFDYEIRNFLA